MKKTKARDASKYLGLLKTGLATVVTNHAIHILHYVVPVSLQVKSQ